MSYAHAGETSIGHWWPVLEFCAAFSRGDYKDADKPTTWEWTFRTLMYFGRKRLPRCETVHPEIYEAMSKLRDPAVLLLNAMEVDGRMSAASVDFFNAVRSLGALYNAIPAGEWP